MLTSISKKADVLSINLRHELSLWSRAKGYLSFVFSALDDALKGKTSFNLHDTFFLLHLDRDYGNSLKSNSFECLINSFKVVIDAHELRKKKGIDEVFNEKQETFFKFNEEDIIDSNEINAVEQIANYWIDNGKTVQVTSIYPLLGNTDFLDLVKSLKVQFVSQSEPYMSKIVCSAISYVAAETIKVVHGDPKLGERVTNVADDFAKQVGPVLDKLTDEGVKSSREKADALNKMNLKTLRGNKWSHTQILRTQNRWYEIKERDKSLKL